MNELKYAIVLRIVAELFTIPPQTATNTKACVMKIEFARRL